MVGLTLKVLLRLIFQRTMVILIQLEGYSAPQRRMSNPNTGSAIANGYFGE